MRFGLARPAAWLAMLLFCSSAMALDRNALLDDANLLLFPRERALPSLQLVDEKGATFYTDSLHGRWHLMFFGFTACPDICPTTLSDMRRLFADLPGDIRKQLQLVLISADPARDTPEALRNYLAYYRAGFMGLTGDMAQLLALSKALGLPIVPPQQTSGNYTVAHSGNIAIVAPNGKLRGYIRSPLKLDALSQALPQLIEAD